MGARIGTREEEAAPAPIPVIAPDGTEGTVPAEYFHHAVTEGGYQIPVTAPDGTRGAIPGHAYAQALKAGYQPTAELKAYEHHVEAKKYDNPVAASAAGFMRSLSLGASDVAANAIGVTTPEELKGWKEYNPRANLGGEAAGLAASLLVPGLGEATGLGAAAKVGAAATRGAEALGVAGAKTVLGRLAGKAVGGAAEGLLFGAGNAVSEHAMGDPELNAQKVLATVGLGGVLGAGAGTVGGLLGEAAGAVKPKLAEVLSGAKESLEDLRNIRSVKATGAIQSDINKLSEQRVQQIGKDLYEAGYITPGSSAREVLEKTKAGVKEQWSRIEGVLKKADEATEGGGFNIGKVVERARGEVLEKIANDPALAPDARKLKRMLDGYEKLATEEGEGIAFSRAHELESNLRKSLKPAMASAAEKDAVADLRGIFRDELGSQLESKVGGEAGAEFEDAMQKYGSFAEAKKWGIRGMKRMEGNRFFSLSDRLGGGFAGMLSGGPMGAATGMATMLGGKLVRERGASVVANLAGRLAESPVLSTIADHFAAAVKTAGPEALGAYAPEMANAAARSSTEALATHITLAQSDPSYRQAASLAGFPGEQAHETAGALEKAHGLHGLQNALDEHDDTMEKLVEKALHKGGDVSAERKGAHVLAKQAFGSKRMRREAGAGHAQHQEDIAQLAGDPHALAERISGNMGDLGKHAPGTVAAISAAASRAVAFLASKAAKPPPQGPLAREWEPSPAERAKFNRYLEAVQDPTSVLKRAAEGRLSPEGVEALKAVYPQLYQSMQQAVLERLTDKPKGVPYSQRLQLGLLAGVDVDGSMSPAAIQRSQAVFSGPSAKSSDDKPGPTAGAAKLTVGKRSMTPMQAVDARGE